MIFFYNFNIQVGYIVNEYRDSVLQRKFVRERYLEIEAHQHMIHTQMEQRVVNDCQYDFCFIVSN